MFIISNLQNNVLEAEVITMIDIVGQGSIISFYRFQYIIHCICNDILTMLSFVFGNCGMFDDVFECLVVDKTISRFKLSKCSKRFKILLYQKSFSCCLQQLMVSLIKCYNHYNGWFQTLFLQILKNLNFKISIIPADSS